MGFTVQFRCGSVLSGIGSGDSINSELYMRVLYPGGNPVNLDGRRGDQDHDIGSLLARL